MKPIIISSEKFEVRILRPIEWEGLIERMDIDTTRICASLLVTGMQYAELKRLRENPTWLDYQFIHLPKDSTFNVKRKQNERAIRLSYKGRKIIQDLFNVPYPLPELPAFDMKLRRLSKKFLDGPSVNNKTFRKTWESWLLYYFPDKFFYIALSQGHTSTTQYEHYLDMPFTEDDRKEMRKWVEGWI